MGHTVSSRRLQARLAEFAPELDHASRREQRHCRRIVALWNARTARGQPAAFHPTLAAAIAGGAPWLQVLCPGCRQIGEVDLRTLDRHPATTIGALIPSLSCRSCCPHPPFARLLALTAAPMLRSSPRPWWECR